MEEDIKIIKYYMMFLKGKEHEFPGTLLLRPAIKNAINRLEEDEKLIEEMTMYVENDSRFKLSPVARRIKEDLLRILKGNQKES